MASNRRNSPGGNARRWLSGAARRLLPHRWRPLIRQTRRQVRVIPSVDISSLPVRPPWWRLIARRLAVRLWTPQGGRRNHHHLEGGTGAQRRDRRETAQTLIRRRPPLAAARSVLRSHSITAPTMQSPMRLVSGVIAALPRPNVGRIGVDLSTTPFHSLLSRSVSTAPPEGGTFSARPIHRAGRPMGAAAQRRISHPRMAVTGRDSNSKSLPLQGLEHTRGLASAEQLWRAAVARQPLESPRPFPNSLRPLVAMLAGSADRPSYTTGPRTRHALAEAGALGATTGDVVHLAQAPSAQPSSIGVLAHELAHARQPIARPRFLLRAPGGVMDADERAARAVGDRMRLTTTGVIGASLGGGSGSRVVSGLAARFSGPGRSAGAKTPMPESAIGTAVEQVDRTYTPDTLGNRGGAAVTEGGSGLTGPVNTVDRFSGPAQAMSAGIVDALPVGGVSTTSVVDLATQAARSAINEHMNTASRTVEATIGYPDGVAASLGEATQSGAGEAPGMIGGSARQWADGATTAFHSGTAGASTVDRAQGASRTAGAFGATSGPTGVDLDRITEALEERLLRQLERRGGRYAGVF